ncbi:peptidoglycan-binding protein LysM [Bibersteinia trehalosi]|uniref:peptidoglycan-binding protein LysM n=1 Tax=Bibersteinia trehalosi TaxID=47735 RepID=UPI002D771D28|nr:peptidoglycan-binding protein LysM [Bibersteinia trehalosi]
MMNNAWKTAVYVADYALNQKAEAKMKSVTGLTEKQTAALLRALAKRESGGNYQIENKFGYLGAYQFGAAALVDVGLVNAEHYKKAVSFNKGVSNGSNARYHKWFLAQNEFWDLKGGKTAFLNSPSVQDEAIVKLMNRNAKTMTAKGVYSGSAENKAGLLMAAHLKGAGNAIKFAKTGVATKDGFGTSIKDYYDLGAKSVRGI